MSGTETTLRPAGQQAGLFGLSLRGLIVPLLAGSLLVVVLVPMPPAVMDVLLAGNIALAAVVFLTTLLVGSPMEFSVFPSVLLGTTLVRLVLNIATTRLILTAGEGGRTVGEAQLAAGEVIWSFSQFVAAGSLAVGVILFAILAVIQFVVITKGAARISEVAARFVLDAMPGKQMAIDADLHAGVIDEDEAQRRREAIADQADFYGAMDGAGKFLRGDAVAAVLITLVNILGGLYVGMVQYGWGWGRTVELFSRLTIGDGLTTQIPAVLVSVSAALMVTRTGRGGNLSEAVVRQLTARPAVLAVTAAFLGLLAMTKLPRLPLGLMAAGCVGLAWVLQRKRQAAGLADEPERKPRTVRAEESEEAMAVSPLQIELGYALICLSETSRGGNLLESVGPLRRELAAGRGLLIPPVRIVDNLSVGSHHFRVLVRGSSAGGGRIQPGRVLAVGAPELLEPYPGPAGTFPGTGAEGVWIRRADRDAAERAGLVLHEPTAVMLAELRRVVCEHAAELLSRQRVVEMLDRLGEQEEALVREAREQLSTGRIQRVLQRLLAEQVSIRDLETILETLCEAAERTADLDEQVAAVREGLSRWLCADLAGAGGVIRCVRAENIQQEAVLQHVAEAGGYCGRDDETLRELVEELQALRNEGNRPVVLCRAEARAKMWQALRGRVPGVVVLSERETLGADIEPFRESPGWELSVESDCKASI